MEKLTPLQYLQLSKWNKFVYKLKSFFCSIPTGFVNFFKKIGKFFTNLAIKIGNEFKDLYLTFAKGDWKTKISYVIFGFGSFARGQWLRGLLFLAAEVVFIFYMITSGAYWLKMMPSLGHQGPVTELVEETFMGLTQKVPVTTYYDNSFKILLYSVLTIFFIIAIIYTWRINIKQNKISEEILASGKKLKSTKDDLHSVIDDQFHKTLLALPVLGITIFTVLPIFFMVLVAFTSYDGAHNGYTNSLFGWDGFKHFGEVLNFAEGQSVYSIAFGEILVWTLIWAFFATFTNYFLGMLVAMIINKKGIKLKKLWRTILVLTIAIPQFISLLYIKQIFGNAGIFNAFIEALGGQAYAWWDHKTSARILVIVINIWIGIPYLMLIATGILMNIPADLYESAKIDGASPWQQYFKITLPYMLFVTGPYLLTSFTGNINNFNVIFLLTGGGPKNSKFNSAGGAGDTDLLITWLYKMTMGEGCKYYLASVIGILVFVLVAVISLIVYSLMPSVKNEEEFQ